MTATYSSGFTIQTKICEGQTVTIPNEFLIIWGVHDLPKDYYPLAGIHAMYAGARTARSRAMTDGFRIESIVEPKWYQAVHYLKSPNLHAMMFAGHGTENGGLILSDDESPIQVTHEGWSQPETLHGSTNNVLEQGPYVHHKLAGMLLLACRSLIPSSDQKVFNPLSIPKDLKGQVSGWEVNVAPGGTLGGYIGDVDHTNIFPRGLFNKGVHIVDLWRMHSGGARYIPGERKLREKKISKRYIRDVAKNTKREIAIIEGRVITPE
jgi:hypothetical protein